jgi:hypothetical protein
MMLMMLMHLITNMGYYSVVLELGAIVTLDHQYVLTILVLHFIGEVFDGLLSLTLVCQEKDPSVS